MVARAKISHEDSYDERATRKAETHWRGNARYGDWGCGKQATEGYAHEYWYEIGVVEALHLVAKHLVNLTERKL